MTRASRLGAGVVHVLFGCAALAIVPVASAFDARPRAVDMELLGGYDANLLDASDAELHAFETGDPSELFVVKRMEDAFVDLATTGRWNTGRILGSPAELRLGYERLQYLHENIRSEDGYAVDARLWNEPSTRLRLRGEFRPQIYGRHRRDKDAAPGEPMFRAETQRRWDADATITHDMGTWSWESGLGITVRDYARPFDERDRWRLETIGGLSYRPSSRGQLRMTGGFQRNWSRNVPYLGSDLSYHEWWMQPAVEDVRLPGAIRGRTYLSVEWRHYRSTDTQDLSHFGRRDLEWGVGGELRGPLSGPLGWKATYDHRQRTADVPSDQIVFDEEGAFHDDVAALGLSWSWKQERRR
jgi:hypothetical protein